MLNVGNNQLIYYLYYLKHDYRSKMINMKIQHHATLEADNNKQNENDNNHDVANDNNVTMNENALTNQDTINVYATADQIFAINDNKQNYTYDI